VDKGCNKIKIAQPIAGLYQSFVFWKLIFIKSGIDHFPEKKFKLVGELLPGKMCAYNKCENELY
jgi:hypothetical protein